MGDTIKLQTKWGKRRNDLSGLKKNEGKGTRVETWADEIKKSVGPSITWDDQVKPGEQKIIKVPDQPDKKNEGAGNE